MEEEDERIQQTAMEVKLKREKIEGIWRERENAIQKVYIILSHMFMYIHTRITYNTHSKCNGEAEGALGEDEEVGNPTSFPGLYPVCTQNWV